MGPEMFKRNRNSWNHLPQTKGGYVWVSYNHVAIDGKIGNDTDLPVSQLRLVRIYD